MSAQARTATEKLSLLSGLHCAELFTDILSAIQERGEDTEEGLLLVETEKWHVKVKEKMEKVEGKELAIKIMIERVEIMREARPPNDHIGNFLSNIHCGCSICFQFLADNLIEGQIEHLRPLYHEEPTTQ